MDLTLIVDGIQPRKRTEGLPDENGEFESTKSKIPQSKRPGEPLEPVCRLPMSNCVSTSMGNILMQYKLPTPSKTLSKATEQDASESANDLKNAKGQPIPSSSSENTNCGFSNSIVPAPSIFSAQLSPPYSASESERALIPSTRSYVDKSNSPYFSVGEREWPVRLVTSPMESTGDMISGRKSYTGAPYVCYPTPYHLVYPPPPLIASDTLMSHSGSLIPSTPARTSPPLQIVPGKLPYCPSTFSPQYNLPYQLYPPQVSCLNEAKPLINSEISRESPGSIAESSASASRKSFASHQELDDHILVLETLDSPRNKFNIKTRHFICQDCGRSFFRKSDLVRHIQIHLGIKPNMCKVCGKQFIQRSALTVHQRVHTGEKPYNCQVCGRAFSDSSSLARHRRIHTRNQKSSHVLVPLSSKESTAGSSSAYRGEVKASN